jgi:hypothetical protein
MPLLCDINGVSANNFYVFGKKSEEIRGKIAMSFLLLLRKLNLVPYPIQFAEINAERKVQQ